MSSAGKRIAKAAQRLLPGGGGDAEEEDYESAEESEDPPVDEGAEGRGRSPARSEKTKAAGRSKSRSGSANPGDGASRGRSKSRSASAGPRDGADGAGKSGSPSKSGRSKKKGKPKPAKMSEIVIITDEKQLEYYLKHTDETGDLIAASEERTSVVKPDTDLIADASSMLMRHRNFILGTSVSDVAAAALEGLARVRLEPETLELASHYLMEMSIGLIIGQTTAAKVSEEFALLKGKGFLKKFDIENRDADGEKDTWVKNCNMNATAYRILGHLIIEIAAMNGSDSAKALKEKRGTMFEPNSDEGIYTTLCKEANAELTDEEKRTPRGLSETLRHICVAVCDAVKASKGDLVALQTIADSVNFTSIGI